MGHPYRIREIAVQAGLSEATVDRVLNGRGGVRASTVAEVNQAIEDLHRQRTQLRLAGRTFVVDLVVDAPVQFSSGVRAALEAELPGIRPAVFRSRFHLTEAAPVADIVATLGRIATRGSQGVVLKAPDDPRVVAAVERLVGVGIPVVTFVTDLPVSPRTAYVGIDNRAVGATAAYLIDQWLGDASGTVLVTRGDGSFRGEDEREMGFRATQRTVAPNRRQVDLVNTDGRDDLHRLVLDALAAHPDIVAVYSMYAFGGNRAVVDAFAEAGRTYRVFVAHDLHEHNLALLHDGHLSAVLHHDLRQDMRHACQVIMQAHGALAGHPRSWHSAIQVVTPYNLPPSPG
ncbi:LacI family DNA-binding transcriptional regulator [Pseudonocardia charpentierae]|uniref:LacI family DNA-binding transcriptional regulator n=1 Tax=Pseudonocardia charpentierae TaxID=3075545 RepID=A0ABU2NGA1_9PSEU|nr:LacI family DNA-binding transcriptional regulator [Pseudonocardia sp. DSM 45834]MDT0352998.1 LacI family DNA-binding transcriptional regulator [Pseudonocardia sp. DSM 45834]